MIHSMSVEARYLIQDIKNRIQTRLALSREDIERVGYNCREFIGDFCSFLSENPSAILTPIHPDRYQLSLVYLFLEQVGKAAVRERKSHYSSVKFSETAPRYFTSFQAKVPDPEAPNYFHPLISNMNIVWDMKRSYPEHVRIWGNLSLAALVRRQGPFDRQAMFPEDINFLFFPIKIETPEQAIQLNPRDFASSRKEQREIAILEGGKKINVTTRYNHKKGQVTLNRSHVLLGHFENQSQSFWVYGNNEKFNQSAKVSLRSPNRRLLFATSPVS